MTIQSERKALAGRVRSIAEWFKSEGYRVRIPETKVNADLLEAADMLDRPDTEDSVQGRIADGGLLPCPFCGGKAVKRGMKVVCGDPETPACSGKTIVAYPSDWNRRATPKIRTRVDGTIADIDEIIADLRSLSTPSGEKK